MLRTLASHLVQPIRWQCHPAFSLIASRGLKQTTGIVGLDVDPKAREHLGSKLQDILDALKVIPEDAQYRINVEAVVRHRQQAVSSEASDQEVEAQLELQLEQLIKECNEELWLIPKMAEWKPWDVPPGHTIPMTEEEPVEAATPNPPTPAAAPPPPKM
ncbi:hypothetical protein WJX72_011824 [[Myrmecia] bisecta]|uniref:NADH dehydrogenase [ubiquinone] 1 alpha subcomplex subunit 5 n=1 Tax=[Myrmecia] bisecta TaxID=41462 RepID=A0AAW1RA50_9CHLO